MIGAAQFKGAAVAQGTGGVQTSQHTVRPPKVDQEQLDRIVKLNLGDKKFFFD